MPVEHYIVLIFLEFLYYCVNFLLNNNEFIYLNYIGLLFIFC